MRREKGLSSKEIRIDQGELWSDHIRDWTAALGIKV